MLNMKTLVTVLLLLVSGASFALSQTTVHRLAFRSHIEFRFATTEVSCVMSNDGEMAKELTFDITLPKQAFITNFSMEIEGVLYPGNVKEKQQARKQYLHALHHGHSGGLVEQKPRHSNKFEVAVNVAAGHNVTFNLIYQELLRRRFGTYRHAVHLDKSLQAKELSVEVFVEERTEIKNVRTPALRADIMSNAVDEGVNILTEITHPTPHTAYVAYRPTPGQLEQAGGGWFVLEYDVASHDAGEIMVVDGYFVHYFLPPSDLPPLPLDIVFVLDISGSMSGRPISQLRDAMSIILDDLRPTDRFNILLFDDKVQKWEERLQEASASRVESAQQYVRGIQARASTDLHLALTRGLDMLQRDPESRRVPMLFFLTDGEATAGIQDPELIVQKVTAKNKGGDSRRTANIFSLAFGSGADYRLLKQVSAQNNGFARKIYEGSDSQLQVSGLYKEIATVVLRGLSIEYHSSTSDQTGRRRGEGRGGATVPPVVRVDNSTITTCWFPWMMGEADAVVAGRIANIDSLLQLEEGAGLTLVVSGEGKEGQQVNLVLTENDITNLTLGGEGHNPFWSTPRNLAKITERAWAFLTIQQLLEEKVAATEDKDLVKDLDARILKLSLKYNFVTPLTSMVVTRPEDDEKNDENSEGKRLISSFIDDDDRGNGNARVQHMHHGGLPGAVATYHSQRTARKFAKLRPSGARGYPQRVFSPMLPVQDMDYDFRTAVLSAGLRPPMPQPTLMHRQPTTTVTTRLRQPTTTVTTRLRQTTTTAPTPTTRTTQKTKGDNSKGRKGKKGGKRKGRCMSNKKVILESVTVDGVHVPKACVEMRSSRVPTNYGLFQSKDLAAAAGPSLTVGLTKKRIASMYLRLSSELVAVHVTPAGALSHNATEGVQQSGNSTQVTFSSGSLDVTFSVAQSRCKATWIALEVNTGDLQPAELLRAYSGVVVDMIANDFVGKNRKSGKLKRRTRKGKGKVSKRCVARGVAMQRSAILSARKLKHYKIN